MAFYTYLWLREDGTPYYVGKGSGDRAHKRRKGIPSSPDRIIVQEYLSEDDAFLAEKMLISLFGRKNIGTGILINLTDGGEGPAGQVMSLEARRKIGEAGKNRSLGYKHTDASKAIIRAKRALQNMSYPRSADFGKWNIGKVRSEETKQKNREWHLGRKASLETLQKMIESMKKVWERRRG